MAENRELALVLKLVADQFQSELKKSGGLLGDFQKIVSDWKVQLTAAGTALFAVAKSTANYGEELVKISQKVGINIEALAGLQYAGRLTDLSNEQLAEGLKFLSQNMVEAAQRTGDGEALFFRLGVSAADATGKLRPTEDVLLDLADVFARSADGAVKTEAAVKLFGKAGLELIPFLNHGKAGLRELMAEAQRLGLVMSKENAEAANAFNDQLTKMAASTEGLKLALGQGLIPVLTEFMNLFGSLTKSNAAQFFFKGLAEQAVLFSTLLKEIGANAQFVFGKLSFEDLKTTIKQIESESSAKLLGILNPEAAQLAAGAGGVGHGTSSKPTIDLKDQAVLGKELVELFLEQNRAIDLGFELERRRYAERRQNIEETALAQKRLDDAQGAIQEARGRAIVKSAVDERKLRDEQNSHLSANLQAWLAYGEAVGASNEFLLSRRLDLVRATLAKELDTTVETAGQMLIAEQNHDQAALDSLRERIGKSDLEIETSLLNAQARYRQAINELSGDFFQGWAAGLRRYAADQSMFGLAADMSRRFFQTTEQGIQKFLFDAAEGRLTRLRDISKSILGIINQLVSQMAAQLITKQLAGAFVGAGGSLGGIFSSFFGGRSSPGAADLSGANFPGFATGGSFIVPGTGGTDRTAVGFWATPGEQVAITQAGQRQDNGVTVIINNIGNNDVQTSEGGRGADGRQLVYVTVRDMVRGMVQSGDMDAPFGRRFGLAPSPGRR